VAPLVAWLIVVFTLGLAALFGRQQVRTLRTLPRHSDLSSEDHTYFRRQAWRRLAGCGLLVAISAMMTVWYVYGLDAGIDALGAARDAQRAAGGDQRFTAEQDAARRFYVAYVSGMLLLLLALLLITGVDVLAIRRYAARHSRQIREGRRAMLENELAALRRERGRQRGDPSSN
jgi:amino acid transporter